MIIHGAASSRMPHLIVVIVNLVFLTLTADPWCRVEASHQVIPSFSSVLFVPAILFSRYRPCHGCRMFFAKEIFLSWTYKSTVALTFQPWKRSGNRIRMSLSRLGEETAVKQVQALTLCFSRKTLTIANNLGLTTEDHGSVTSISSAIKKYVTGHINESVE